MAIGGSAESHKRVLICVLTALMLSTACASARTFGPPEPDSVDCPFGDPLREVKTSTETFDAWVERYRFGEEASQITSTESRDRMTLDFTSSEDFVDRIFGKGGVRGLYDPQHHLLAYCRVYDTAIGIFISANISTPPFAIIRADLSGFATQHGIRLGSTVADVRRVYGRAPVVYVRGTPELAYQRLIPMPGSNLPFGIWTSFIIVRGKVARIERVSGV